jgi:hypothetical protein
MVGEWHKKNNISIRVDCYFLVDVENYKVKYISGSREVLEEIMKNENRNHVYKESKLIKKQVVIDVI